MSIPEELQPGDFYVSDETLRYLGPGPTTEAEAWHITIRKWLYLVGAAMHGVHVDFDGGVMTCGLCMFNCGGLDCKNCPVSIWSGHTGCISTPYAHYLEVVHKGSWQEKAEAAFAELEFLLEVRARGREKQVLNYLQKPYTVEYIYTEGEDSWFARVLELPGCMTQGDTFRETEEMIQDAAMLWIESALEGGDEIPEPQKEPLQGTIQIRGLGSSAT